MLALFYRLDFTIMHFVAIVNGFRYCFLQKYSRIDKYRMKDKGYFQIYTGNGKGKTTASLGLTLRAVGAGYKVYIGQFIKLPDDYSEIKAIKDRLPEVVVEQYGTEQGYILGRDKDESDTRASEQGFEKLREAMLSGKYDIVIADEINCSISLGLLDIENVLELVAAKPTDIELVFTGRDAAPSLIKIADLVSVIEDRKHYYNTGVMARSGIES